MAPDITQLRTRLADHQQEHLLAFWDDLSPAEQVELSASLAKVDFAEIEALLARGPLKDDGGADAQRATGPTGVQFDDPGRDEAAERAIRRGGEALKAGQVGVLIVVELAESRADDEQIRLIERLQAGDVFLIIGIDVSAVGVDGKEDRAIETVGLAEDLGQHGAGLFGAVLFIPGDEHDFFAVGLAGLGREMQPRIRCGDGEGQGGEQQEGGGGGFHTGKNGGLQVGCVA